MARSNTSTVAFSTRPFRLGTIFVSGLLAALAMTSCSADSGRLASYPEQAKSSRIVGGKDVTLGTSYSKSIVAIYNNSSGSLCTGSILSNTIVLTAAHCVYGASNADLRIVYGIDIDGREAIRARVDGYKVYPDYPKLMENERHAGDIALVHFSGGLLPGYKPASLLTDASVLKVGQSVLLVGYGISDAFDQIGAGRLRSAEVSIIETAFSESEILVDQRQGQGACHGDSGGPAFLKVGDQYLVIGVTSHSIDDPEDLCNQLVAYSSVSYYNRWIVETMKVLDAATAHSSR